MTNARVAQERLIRTVAASLSRRVRRGGRRTCSGVRFNNARELNMQEILQRIHGLSRSAVNDALDGRANFSTQTYLVVTLR
jgi:hypothetical protein